MRIMDVTKIITMVNLGITFNSFTRNFLLTFMLACSTLICWSQQVQKGEKFQIELQSEIRYSNPIYDVSEFYTEFTSPTGRELRINGFWDGDLDWKVRFAPDEIGQWSYKTICSDTINNGLHDLRGQFECVSNTSELSLYKHGSIVHVPGTYYLSHQDGKPFFWTACTAWNGALKSTDEEWDRYLQHRVDNHYNTIQLVTTQWRGADMNSQGQVAFNGSGRITVNPEFFQHMDKKIDRVNEYGLLAAPVILWALPKGAGRYLSPGYHLPIDEAVLLAKYIVARYGGNQVVWLLGGDGKYFGDLEERWKTIGRRVFSNIHHAPVSLHPHGVSWIGDIYANEDWMSIVGYQSSHSNAAGTVDWINKGPISNRWDKIPARPIINLEPNYEQIRSLITDKDVRNASYWSVFATPPAGISYGAHGIWPWLREGESILNHPASPGTSSWENSMELPGSIQVGYLSNFIQQFAWWDYTPAPELLIHQPGESTYNRYISLLRSKDYGKILVYIPEKGEVMIRNPLDMNYEAQWFDPVSNSYHVANLQKKPGHVQIMADFPNDMLLILTAK